MKIGLCARISARVAAVLAAVGAVFGSLMMFLNFDVEIGYFKSNVLTVIFTLFCILGLAALLLLAFLTDKSTVSQRLSAVGKPEKLSYAAAAVLTLATSVAFAAFYFTDKSRKETLTLAIAGCGILAAAYFVARYLRERKLTQNEPAPTTASAFLGLGTVIWFVLMIGYMYFDNFLQKNAPVKTLLTFGAVAAMLATLADVRYLIGRQFPRYAVLMHSFCVFIGFTASVPTILHNFAHKAEDPHYPIIAFAVLIFAAVSAFRLKALVSDVKIECEGTDDEFDLEPYVG